VLWIARNRAETPACAANLGVTHVSCQISDEYDEPEGGPAVAFTDLDPQVEWHPYPGVRMVGKTSARDRVVQEFADKEREIAQLVEEVGELDTALGQIRTIAADSLRRL
jgi:hypothetical protein